MRRSAEAQTGPTQRRKVGAVEIALAEMNIVAAKIDRGPKQNQRPMEPEAVPPCVDIIHATDRLIRLI
jgi:hypothetical protein